MWIRFAVVVSKRAPSQQGTGPQQNVYRAVPQKMLGYVLQTFASPFSQAHEETRLGVKSRQLWAEGPRRGWGYIMFQAKETIVVQGCACPLGEP